MSNDVSAFVDAVEARLKCEPGVFSHVCKQAKEGRMGFGRIALQWGNAKTGAG